MQSGRWVESCASWDFNGRNFFERGKLNTKFISHFGIQNPVRTSCSTCCTYYNIGTGAEAGAVELSSSFDVRTHGHKPEKGGEMGKFELSILCPRWGERDRDR